MHIAPFPLSRLGAVFFIVPPAAVENQAPPGKERFCTAAMTFVRRRGIMAAKAAIIPLLLIFIYKDFTLIPLLVVFYYFY